MFHKCQPTSFAHSLKPRSCKFLSLIFWNWCWAFLHNWSCQSKNYPDGHLHIHLIHLRTIFHSLLYPPQCLPWTKIWNSFYPKQWHITGWEGRVSEWTLTICQYTTLFTWRARPNLLVTTAHKITITNCASWTDLRSVRSGSGVDKRNRFLDPALSMSKMATESGQHKSGRA